MARVRQAFRRKRSHCHSALCAEPYSPFGERLSWEHEPMRKAEPSPIVTDIGKALSQRFEQDVHEPLPERWVDLIHHLNEKERAALVTKPPSKSVLKRHCS
jgi:hypothetical protein